jgi:uncharacterized repeat protein (TIGR01451 family)
MLTQKRLFVSFVLAELALAPFVLAGPGSKLLGRRNASAPQAASAPSTSSPHDRPAAQAADTAKSPDVRPASRTVAAPAITPAAKTPAVAIHAITAVSALPAVYVETVGPSEVNVGKAGTFTITVRNAGETNAQGIVVRTTLPAAAELRKSNPTPKLVVDNQVQFDIGDLPAKGERKIDLEIIPRQAGAIELATTLSLAVSTQSPVMVRQPRLAITCDAPSETIFGELATIKLKVTNTGDGIAEDVAVRQVRDLERGEQSPRITQLPAQIGALAAGESREIELSVPANVAGALRASVVAEGDGGLEATTTAEVRVRRPMIEIKSEGPSFRYINRTGDYTIHLTNPGDAAAKNVTVQAQIPAGLQVVAAERRATFNRELGTLTWELPQVEPGSTVSLQYRIKGIAEGEQRQQVRTIAEHGLSAQATLVTRVGGVADITMTVSDTAGPIEVGGAVEYVIVLKNRGTKAAGNVRLTATMPDGLQAGEPAKAEYTVEGSRIAFALIDELKANEEQVLRVSAVGRSAGEQPVRFVLTADALSREIVVDESTLFYSGDSEEAPERP